MSKLKLNDYEIRNYKIIKRWSEGKINFKRAKLESGFSKGYLYQLKRKYKEKGKDGFIHGNRGRKPKTTIDQSLSTKIISLYKGNSKDKKGKYYGCNFTHYQYLLKLYEGIEISYTYLYNLMIKHGILSPKAHKITRKEYKKVQLAKKKENKNITEKELDKKVNAVLALEDASPMQPRIRYMGENIEMDASSLNYFGNIVTHLHLAIDSATNTCVGGYFDYQETLNGYYHTVYQIFMNYGLPFKITTDGRTIFDYKSSRMKKDENAYFTQFKMACNKLGIDLHITSKAEGKPHVERYNQTFQDRLSIELHINNITTLDNANKYLTEVFIPNFNKQFARKVLKKDSVFAELDKESKENLNLILAVLSTRVIDKGSSIRYKTGVYLPYNENNELCPYRKGTKCTVIEAFDKKLYVQIYNEIFRLYELQEKLNDNESRTDYYEKIRNLEKKKLPEPQVDWDYERLNKNIGKIHKQYKIYDSHNPKF